MTRFVIKPLVYLLVFGLLGCTSTSWTVMDEPVDEEPVKLIRVTLNDGDRFELKHAVVTDSTVTGMQQVNMAQPNSLITFLRADIESIEIADQKSAGGKSVLLITLVLIVFVLSTSSSPSSSECSGEIWPCPFLSR